VSISVLFFCRVRFLSQSCSCCSSCSIICKLHPYIMLMTRKSTDLAVSQKDKITRPHNVKTRNDPTNEWLAIRSSNFVEILPRINATYRGLVWFQSQDRKVNISLFIRIYCLSSELKEESWLHQPETLHRGPSMTHDTTLVISNLPTAYSTQTRSRSHHRLSPSHITPPTTT